MSNNPVAYISKNGVLFKELPPEPMDLEPLYKLKKLTIEDIDVLAEYHGIDSLYETGRRDFAAALLRKAQDD